MQTPSELMRPALEKGPPGPPIGTPPGVATPGGTLLTEKRLSKT